MSCADVIIDAAKRSGIEFEKDEAQEIVDILEERLYKRVENALADEYVDIFKLARNIAKQARINAVIEKRSRILNAKAYIDIMSAISKNPDDPAEALSAILVGSAKLGNLESVDARQHALNTQYSGTLLAALEDAGLSKLFKSADAEELIFRAMFDGDKFEVKSDLHAQVKQLADILKKHQKVRLERKNLHGAVVAEAENYAVRQNHDPILLRDGARTPEEMEAAQKKWVRYMLERNGDGTLKRLSAKTFENKPSTKEVNNQRVPYTEEMFLEDIWLNLVSGQHQKVSEMKGMDGKMDVGEAFKGPSNLAKKLSGSRVIHFKDGASAYAYMKQYSRMSLVDSFMAGIENDANAIGLMEKFGTNPEAMFSRVLKDITSGARTDILKLDKVNEFKLRSFFKEVDGTATSRGAGKPIAFGADIAGLASGWRMVQSMAKLGAATISSFGDIATNATFINTHTDRGIFGSYAKALSFVFARFGSKDQKKLAYLLGVGTDGALGGTHARFGSNDSLPGVIGKMQQHYFRLNLMTFWNDDQKSGVAKILAADLATYKNDAFESINISTRNGLKRYGIEAAEWDVLRQMDTLAVDGREYIFAGGIDTIPTDVIEAAALAKINEGRTRKIKKPTQAAIDKYKNDLATKYSMYITDSADTAIPTPGAKEKAYLNLGTERGTVVGEAVRAFMQFKAFPVTYVTKAAQRQRYARIEEGKSGMFGIAQMMIGTTMMGYLSVTMKDILKGKTPQEVFSDEYVLNPKLLTRALVQGGGMGIYGDFLFGEYGGYGRGLIQTMSGPTFGSIDEIGSIYTAARGGDMDALQRNTAKFVTGNIPGMNLFYTKTALDYLFIHGLMEHINPGYLKRTERRMRKDMDQQYYFPPSQSAVQF